MKVTSRDHLLKSLNSYSSPYTAEAEFTSRFLELLQSSRCYFRDHLPGHITGSAWIINPSRDSALLVHHRKLNRWLQPGGHADGDEDILHVSLREAMEETGLKNLTLLHDGIFDIDIHAIPERNEFPEHLHYDVRFAFQANDQEALMLSEESHSLAWIKLEELMVATKDNASISRMAEKSSDLP